MPYTFISSSPVVEIHFTALNMNADDDFRKITMMGAWTSVREEPCSRPRRLGGPSGSIQVGPSAGPAGTAGGEAGAGGWSSACEGLPWLVEPAAGRYLYVTVKGLAIHPNDTSSCATKNRVALYAGSAAHVLVCPEPRWGYGGGQVEVGTAPRGGAAGQGRAGGCIRSSPTTPLFLPCRSCPRAGSSPASLRSPEQTTRPAPWSSSSRGRSPAHTRSAGSSSLAGQ